MKDRLRGKFFLIKITGAYYIFDLIYFGSTSKFFLFPFSLGCDFGRYGTKPGVCEKCTPGKYQDAKGMTMCTNCKQDTYSEIYEAKAMADCISCAGTKTTGANNTGNINISACVCKKDIYYQDQNDCFACPRGSICNRPEFNFNQDGVVIQEVYPRAGHWRSKDTDAYFSPCAKSLV